MTISSETRVAGPFICNGATVAYPFTFKIFTAADIGVTMTDAAGTGSQLVRTTHYSVALNADQDANPGGTVTTTAAYAAGNTIVLTSAISALQSLDLTNQGGFYPAVINRAIDKLTILIQQILGPLGRSIKYSVGDGALTTLPTAAQRAGKFLAFDALGNPTSASGTGADAGLRADLAASTGAGMLGWIGNITGAVQRLLSSKLNDFVSIKDVGGVVDGVTDDSAAITKARSAADGKLPILFGGKTFAAGYWENLSPLVQEWIYGSAASYKTDVVATKPITSIKLFNGTPQSGAGFAGYAQRTDIYTPAGVDVSSTVGIASIVNALSTNTGGAATINNTNQVAILANSSAQSAAASAPVTALNCIASSLYTGAVWQPVVGGCI